MFSLRAGTLTAIFGLLIALTAGDAVAQEQAQEQDLQQFTVAVNNAPDHVTALQGLETLTADNIEVVSTSDVGPQEAVTRLTETAQADAAGLENLRAALGESEAVAAALEASETSADDIIAVHVSEDGYVTLYSRPE